MRGWVGWVGLGGLGGWGGGGGGWGRGGGGWGGGVGGVGFGASCWGGRCGTEMKKDESKQPGLELSIHLTGVQRKQAGDILLAGLCLGS